MISFKLGIPKPEVVRTIKVTSEKGGGKSKVLKSVFSPSKNTVTKDGNIVETVSSTRGKLYELEHTGKFDENGLEIVRIHKPSLEAAKRYVSATKMSEKEKQRLREVIYDVYSEELINEEEDDI